MILWDLATGQTLDSAQTCDARITRIALSPDDTRLAVVCADGLQIWSLQGNALRRQTQFVSPLLDYGAPADVAWSPDGRLVLLGGAGEDPAGGSIGQVWVLDGRNGQVQQTHTTGHSAVSSVLWLDSGRQFAAVSQDGGLQVFDMTAPDQQTAADPSFSNAALLDAAWLPNSSGLVTLSEYGAVRVWDVEPAEILHSYQIDVVATGTLAVPTSLVFALSPDGRRAAVGLGRGVVQVIDLESGQLTGEFSVQRRIVSPDGVPTPLSSSVNCVAWSPDGRYLAAAAYTGVWVWDFQSGELRWELDRPGAGATELAWSPDGARLAAAWGDTTGMQDDVVIWDIGSLLTGRASSVAMVGQGREEWITSLAWSPDSNRLAVGGLGYVSILISNGGRVRRLEGNHTCGIAESLAWSPDGSLLATGCSSGALLIWDAGSWELAQAFYYAHPPISGLSSGTAAVAWSPDGRLLASGGADGIVRLWGVR